MATYNQNQIGGAVTEIQDPTTGKITTTPLASPVNQSPVGGAISATGMLTQDGTNAITPHDLQPTASLKLPQQTQSTTAEGITGLASSFINSNNKELQNIQAQKDQSKEDVTNLMNEIAGVQGSRAQLEQQQGLDKKSQSLTDATNKLEASQRAQLNELRALDGQGLTDVQKTPQAKEINRRYAFEQADLALIQSAANRDLATAQSIVDRKIELQLEPLKNKLEYAKFFYNENKDLFTKAEDRAFQAKTKQLDREYETQKEFEQRKGQQQLQALKDGNFGLYKALSGATNDKDIANITYQNTVPTGGKTKAQTIAESIFSGTSNLDIKSLPITQRAEVDIELNKLKKAALASGDMTGLIRASAGGKDVSDTFTQSFEKALDVVGQLSDLKNSLKGEVTGPFAGIIRSNNPYDTKAQQIKAQLSAIIPNLARGIYGEVGVLTDNDIENYAKTLGNLTSTEDLNDILIGITLKSVQRALENKIKVQAGFGRDVSGILDTYEQIKSSADALVTPNITQNGQQTYNGVIMPSKTSGSTYQGINISY